MEIERANLQKSNFIDAASRYNSSPIIYWGPKRLITFEIYKRKKPVDEPDQKVYVISPGTQYRPDLVAFRAYGDPRYWWKIMEFNKIYDILDFKTGRTIVIPGVLI